MHTHIFEPSKILASRPWYERALGAIAPSWELRRMQARVNRHLFEYQAAQSDRLFSPKTTALPSESDKVARDRNVMMFEARDLVENFGPAKVILTKFAENLAPTEYSPQTGDRAYDQKLAEYFHAWCKRCDFLGLHSFKKLVELAIEIRPVDGDCGVIIRRMTDDALRLQLVAGDRIGNPNESTFQENYFSGITVDGYGRPVSYRVFRITRFGSYAESEDIPAANFAHYFDPFRADQYRGVTDFHSVLRTARMLKDILEAEQVGVEFASQQAALIFNEYGAPQSRNLFSPSVTTTLPNDETKKQEYSEFGIIRYLTRGDKVETMPSRPGSAFRGFTDLLMEHFALGLGVPKGVLFGTQEYQGPSVRAEFAQADRAFARHKSVLQDKILDPIKDAVLLNGFALGEIEPPAKQSGESSVQAMRRALRGLWRFPPKQTIDVGRESDAKINEHQAGLRSAQEIAAEENADAFERLEQNAQIAAEVKRLAEKYDVPELTIKTITKTLPQTPAAAAAIGEKTGEAAAETQKQATAKPADQQSGATGDDDGNNDTEDDDETQTVTGRLSRHATRRQRSLENMLRRTVLLNEVRERLKGQVKDGEQMTLALSRIGYLPPTKPANPPQPATVTVEEIRDDIKRRLETDAKLSALCENLKARQERLTAAAIK